MNRNKAKFIFTNNKESANQLKQLGFNLIKYTPEETVWLFENNNKIYFDKIDNVAFTNKINFDDIWLISSPIDEEFLFLGKEDVRLWRKK